MANELVVNISAETGELDQGIGNVKKTLLAVSTGAAAAGIAIAAAFGAKLLDTIKDSSNALTTFQTQTGATDLETKKFGESIKSVYKEGLGESLNDVASNMAIVKQQSGLLGAESPKDIEKITKKALVLNKALGLEVNESVRSAGAMIKSFGIESDEAFDLMAKGMQVGLNKSDDLLDTLNEYSPDFKDIGFNAKDMFRIIKNGSEAGAFTIDKTADAIREFSIRAKDGSATSADAFKSLGFNANAMFQNFAKGGEIGKKSFSDILEGLRKIKDPVEQDRIGVELFGTMWEELGSKIILSLDKTDKSFDNVKGKVDEINKIQFNDLFSEWEKFKRNLTTDIVLPIAEDLKPVLGDLQDMLKETKKGLEWAGVLDTTSKGVKSLVSKENQDGFRSMNGLLVDFDKNTKTSTIASDVSEIATSINTMIKGVKKLLELGGPLGDFFNALDKINPFKNLLVDVDLKDYGKKSGNTLMSGFNNGISESQQNAQFWGSQTGNNFKVGLDLMEPQVTDSGKKLSSKVGTELNKTNSNSIGANVGNNYANGISSTSTNVSAASTNIANQTKKIDKSSESIMWGKQTSNNLASGLISGSGNVSNSSSNIASTINKNINSGDSRYWGSTIMQNLMDGLWSKLGQLKKVCKDIAQAISDFFPHSPAKEGALRNFPKTGKVLMQQLMDGIEAQKANISQLTSDVTQDISNNVVVSQSSNTNMGAITIPIYLDGKKITEVVAPRMTKMIRLQGGY